MKGVKLFYTFQCPIGARDSKIGITGHPAVRLGGYQNSYSRNSHVACFNMVYYGPSRAIENLERVLKQEFDWDIERDGRGASEWISGYNTQDITAKVEEVIDGYRFKIQKVPKKFLPLTVDNLLEFEKYLESKLEKPV